jgi:acyl-CoA thioester hydrolase
MSTPTEYKHIAQVQTRWSDNDIYGHVNNVTYYSYFDSVMNRYLIDSGALDIQNGNVVGFVVESNCKFLSPLAYPDTVTAGLRVGKLGNSSVRYELALWDQVGKLCAEGYMVHVFVDRQTNRPTPMPGELRAALQSLMLDSSTA